MSDAAGPFTLMRPTVVRFLGLRVPRRIVSPLIAAAGSDVMRRIRAARTP